MKHLLAAFIFLAPISSILSGAEDIIHPVTTDLPVVSTSTEQTNNNIMMLDHLIATTQKNLENQKQLRTLIQEYLDIYEKYLQDTNNKQLSFRMILKAKEVTDKIKETHLTQAFEQEFISELTFFSNIASKWD
jgi:hypothetical protein